MIPDNDDYDLSMLADRLDAFSSSWDSDGAAPAIADFLPDGTNELRRMMLIELIKIDLERRWQLGQPRDLEDYLAEFAELADDDGGLPGELIHEEYQVRRQVGEDVNPGQYFSRFPDRILSLRRLFNLGHSVMHTKISSAKSNFDDIQAGQQIEDFDLLAELGAGTFARVFLARQRSMQRLVALKISQNSGSEPQTLAQLDHPHVVRVYDQRLLPEKQVRLLYMQYLAGGTLQEAMHYVHEFSPSLRNGKVFLQAVDAALERQGDSSPVDSLNRRKLARASWPEVVCRVGAQLAAALDYACGRGVLHRDVKPANVLLSAEAAPKLADFNISFSDKLEGDSPGANFGGSLAYMSPEQLEACNPAHQRQPDSLDGQSDLYSLAVMLWEMLHGERPFRDRQSDLTWSDRLAEMTERRRTGVDVEKSDRDRNELTDSIEQVLRTALEYDPQSRWTNGREMARQLMLCLQPRARRILQPASDSWAARVARFPLMMLLPAVLIPNLLAAVFNLTYNYNEIVKHLTGSQSAFWAIQTTINAIAFPLGLAILGWFVWPAYRGLLLVRRGEQLDEQASALARGRMLSMGHYAALVGMAEWTVAGLAYPISLHALLGSLPLEAYLHFVASLVLCGLIAAAYPFFFAAMLSVRVYFPYLLGRSSPQTSDLEQLRRVGRQAMVYLWMAGSVPMLSVVVLVLSGMQNRFALSIVSTAGLVGFALAFWIYRNMQADVAALLTALSDEEPDRA